MIIGWLVVVLTGLFVPLMDNDSAHHANIALRMYLTGDYVNLIDYDGPYLDKPHLHFWLSALSYHLFGVTGFAYKFPSFLFSLVGVWAVYRSGVLMMNKRAGIASAIIYATSASFLLSLNDVRMDAILSACVAASIWQIAGYFASGGYKYILGAGGWVALGFCTKGHIAVFIPVAFALSVAFSRKQWNRIFHPRVLLGLFSFLVVISPVAYCYYLQFNLHPEVVVRGGGHINGVRFILWDQTLGRYSGEMGVDGGRDKFFFFHTFLWVFAPWSVVGLISLFRKGGVGGSSSTTRAILPVLLIFGMLVGFSSFKLPHYLNIVLPLSSLWIAELYETKSILFERVSIWLMRGMWVLLGVFLSLVLVWWFPSQPYWFWLGLIAYLTFLFYMNKKKGENAAVDYLLQLSAVVLVIFWILSVAFYEKLLSYQGGTVLAEHKTIAPIKDSIYSLQGFYSSSFYFNSKTIRKEVSRDSVGAVKYVLLDAKQISNIEGGGVRWLRVDSVVDYEITKLTGSFLNPETREGVCTKIYLLKRE